MADPNIDVIGGMHGPLGQFSSSIPTIVNPVMQVQPSLFGDISGLSNPASGLPSIASTSGAAAPTGGLGIGGLNFSMIGTGISDLFGAAGDAAEGEAYKKAGILAGQNAQYAGESSAIQKMQAQREIYQTLSAQRAQVAGNGLGSGGSNEYLFKSSVSQGALTQQLLGIQGQINVNSYTAQQAAYQGQAEAASMASKGATASGIGQLIGGVAGALSFFSDEALKEDIVKLRTLPDGMGVYRFRYLEQPTIWVGLIAQDVRQFNSAAVFEDPYTGYLRVDYEALGMTMEAYHGE